MKGFTIAIDGPVAAGKGTIAPLVAKKLKGVYLDTGAMYRCVALYSLRNNVNLDNPQEIEDALQEIDIDITHNEFFLNGEDVTEEIRTKKVDFLVPKIAGISKVREVLIPQQKKIADKAINLGHSFIAEGRDIATKVIPNADLKIFLTADLKTRAQRRLEQKLEKHFDLTLEQIMDDVIKRDREDVEINKTLVNNPQDYGYVVLDNTNMTEEETVDFILEKVKELNDTN